MTAIQFLAARQTFDITGIRYENIPAVNAYLEDYIKEVDTSLCDVDMDTVAGQPQEWDPEGGYPTIGARNITACVGNYHCICGNCNTFELARKIEPLIFPSHYHIKINIAAVPMTAIRRIYAISASSAPPA